MANLYELMAGYEFLSEAMDDPELELDQLKAVVDHLDDTRGSLKEKVDNVCRVLANLAGEAARYKVEEQRLSARRKAVENKHEALRDWVRQSMRALDVKSIKTDLHSISIGAGVEQVVVNDESKIPDDYWRVKKDVDKSKIMENYKQTGEVVPGVDVRRGEPRLLIR